MVHKLQTEEAKVIAVSRFRSTAAQVIACMSPNLLLLDLGMAISFTTIALPNLLNAKDGLSLNDEQASWFGGIPYLTQPLGALISGPLVDYFGRKKANFLANFPHLIAWILMYYSWNLPSLFIANALLGVGSGVMEAPINSYVGEVTEPSIRGALCTFTQMFTSVGTLCMYFLGKVVTWRQAAVIAIAPPVASMLLILLVPESPTWLLYRGRQKQALKSLCNLRGWTTTENVRDEFDKLVDYTKELEKCAICVKVDPNNVNCNHHKMNWIRRTIDRFRYVMMSKETVRPLTLVILYFAFHIMSGYIPIRPNMVNVCGAFGMPDDGKDITLMVGIITFVTGVLVIGIIKMFGKRKLAVTAMLGIAISSTALSVYAKNNLDKSVFSYDTNTFPTEKNYVPQMLFYSLTTFTGFAIPWVLLGEVFPFRSRASAQGLAAAANYIINFIGAKTFINLETSVHLWGAFAVYAGIAYLGVIYLYFFLPETEGKSLQEIESYYSGKLRIFADDPFINIFKKLKR
ncbi:facilitated trehalose transporter Tret1-like [Galleria mellonella]|uniref:Facilitated trehalose transporter Tret1-like n=1 Tax=Galleria mellonella TaxID=7137 RepID=A0A6J1WXW9_GALME|nr:facilitated trehalose transporter Tret1-like [Galleria mellonella]